MPSGEGGRISSSEEEKELTTKLEQWVHKEDQD